jgi:endonuclease-3
VEAKPTPRRKARQPAKRIKNEDGTVVKVEPPSDWEQIYRLLKQMRYDEGGKARNAAVDTMGCHSLALKTASEKDQRFHTLIALMLSSQTKDTTNFIAMRRLQTELPAARPGGEAGLNLENILAVAPEKLNELIWCVGFHNNKTKYIKSAAVILRDQYAGDIPDTAEGLMSLPGVGPKMAYLCLSAAWGKIEGIGVDVHVHRITNMWKWQRPPSKNPEETRKALESWLPREYWQEINHLLVGFGQTVCTPEAGRRRCGECEIGLAGLCPAADRAKVNAGRRAREEGLKVEYEAKEEGGEVKEDMKVVKEGNERETTNMENVKAEEAKVKLERKEIPMSELIKLEEKKELGVKKEEELDVKLP